jgi:hypothetical protein
MVGDYESAREKFTIAISIDPSFLKATIELDKLTKIEAYDKAFDFLFSKVNRQ